jgi:hypothetical protein
VWEEHAIMHQVQFANHGVSTRALGQLFMMVRINIEVSWNSS